MTCGQDDGDAVETLNLELWTLSWDLFFHKAGYFVCAIKRRESLDFGLHTSERCRQTDVTFIVLRLHAISRPTSPFDSAKSPTTFGWKSYDFWLKVLRLLVESTTTFSRKSYDFSVKVVTTFSWVKRTTLPTCSDASANDKALFVRKYQLRYIFGWEAPAPSP